MPFEDMLKDALEQQFEAVEYHDDGEGYWVSPAGPLMDEDQLDYLLENQFAIHAIDFDQGQLHVRRVNPEANTRFERRVQRANQHGSKKVTVPKQVTGPNAEEIAIGDTVALAVIGVDKDQGED